MKVLFAVWLLVGVIGFVINIIRWRRAIRGAKGLDVSIANIDCATGNVIIAIWFSVLTAIGAIARGVYGWRWHP